MINKMKRETCPVCNFHLSTICWIIPFKPLPEPVILPMAKIENLSTLDAKDRYVFAQCMRCHSVYLETVPTNQSHVGDHYVQKMGRPEHADNSKAWCGYYSRYERFIKHVPDSATIMWDVACGIGQYLIVANAQCDRNWKMFVGIDGNLRYVRYMDRHFDFIQAVMFNLNQLSCNNIEVVSLALDGYKQPDLIVFSEAFEHVTSGYRTVRSLASALKPNGILFFSTQAMGTNLPVRPEETTYSTIVGLEIMCRDAGLQIIECDVVAGRQLVTARKTEIPINESKHAKNEESTLVVSSDRSGNGRSADSGFTRAGGSRLGAKVVC